MGIIYEPNTKWNVEVREGCIAIFSNSDDENDNRRIEVDYDELDEFIKAVKFIKIVRRPR